MLSLEEIQELYAARAERTAPQGMVLIEDEDGKHVWMPYNPRKHKLGSFQGRAGTMQRNSKGISRRKADGRRFYVSGDSEVIAYKLK